MLKTLYKKNPYFFNLLFCNIFWSVVRIIQWIELRPDMLDVIIKYIAIEFVYAQLICMVMILIYKWASKQKIGINIIVFILFSLISPGLLFILSNGTKYYIWKEGILAGLTFEALKSAIYYQVMFFVALGGIVYLTRFRINYIQQKEATTKAESLAKDTQLKMLRYQINPHFLFNILNSLNALIDENKEIAKKLIIDISEYYRSTLDKQIQNNSIESEINTIKKYLEIQKIRFEENFEYEISVDERAKAIPIPSFIIHLLIENAIKYGLTCFEKKLVIKLNVTIVENTLSITVINSGKMVETNKNIHVYTEGTGNGVDNITHRLKLFFEDNFTFSLNEENNWVIAKIDIHNLKL